MGRADNENLGIAFALVIGAGAATAVGAAVVFVPALVKLASRKTLASALGLSAGVMTYVSFVEIFAKSSGAFEDAGHDEDKAYILATLCFFAGVVLMVVSMRKCSWVLSFLSVVSLTFDVLVPSCVNVSDSQPNGHMASGWTPSSSSPP